MRTRREIRAILENLMVPIFNCEVRSVSLYDEATNTKITSMAISKKPHITWLLLVSMDGKEVVGSGTATCDEKDEWNPILGDRIAINKALDEVVDRLVGKEPAQETKGSFGARQICTLLFILQRSDPDEVTWFYVDEDGQIRTV